MSITVARTCTEVPSQGVGNNGVVDAKPLSAYRSRSAYVLLGDPGSGKTTEFVKESQALGGAAEYVTARNFVKRDLDSHPEWRDRTLFIDGLDEMRAGAADARVPLDEIRSRLERLGTPSFRISCREADWLGPNDRRSLEEVSPDSAITVLLLDRLSDEAARELLGAHVHSSSADVFEDEARRRGLGGMLGNPQALELLAEAVEHGGAWPESRLETLDLACRKMAAEHNDEHQAVEPTHLPENILDAAGRLCALLLLCGFEGYTLAPGGDRDESYTSGFVPLDDLGRASADPSRELLKSALSTKLFEAAGERRFVPRHRQIAEFLAGRYLAKLIRGGLPARRVVALMTGTSDGRVVTVLRGLSAWLAAHPGEGRRQLIDADPVGVGLYGDLGDFTSDDRECLFKSLVEFAAQGPLFGHAWQDGRADGYREDTAWAFRSVASADMLESIRNLLYSPTDEVHRDRTAAFILEVLSKAEESEKQSLAALEPDLMTILRDADRPPWVVARALDAYIQIAPPGSRTDETLAALLDEIRDGSVPDPDDRLRKALLKHLYPDVIGPRSVWRYALPPYRHNAISDLGSFSNRNVLRESSDQNIAELLDALCDDATHLIPALANSYLDDLPVQLLARGLRAFGDTAETERLFGWLDVAGRTHRARPRNEDDARFVQRWLESRPHVQKAILLVWLRRGAAHEPGRLRRHWSCDALHRSELPGDFGLWCLDQAAALEHDEPALAQELLSQAYMAVADPSIGEGLTLAVVRERVGKGVLARRLDELCDHRSTHRAEDDEWHRELEELREQRNEEQRQRQANWAGNLRAEFEDLSSNRFFAPNLHTLAQVYLGIVAGTDRATSPRRCLCDFIGGDEVLVDAVMAAIRSAVLRDDLPEVEETIALHLESKHSWLAYPVLASLHLLDAEDPAYLDRISADRKRRALAIHYCVPSGDESRPWHDRWFQQEPDLVLDVLQRCADRALRAGSEFVSCLNALDSFKGHDDLILQVGPDGTFTSTVSLDSFKGHDDLVHDTRLRVLDSIPARGPNKQLGLLDNLLARAMQHPDRASLRELAARKSSLKSMSVAQRVRWFTVDALLSAGPSLQPVKEYVSANNTEVRVRHLAEFLRRTSRRDDMRRSVLADVREPEALRDAIEILGPSFGPTEWGGSITLGMEMSDLIGNVIEQLGTVAGDEAGRSLQGLIDDPRLARWQDRLKLAHERQRVVHRDASYRHPGVGEVQRTLRNDAPTNAADLAALLAYRIDDISEQIQGDSSNPWRKYWNVDQYGRPADTRPENLCRDVLLDALKARLPAEVDATPEGRYAAANRADVRASCAGFNVPVEIKKNSHSDLWSAIQRQLIGQYTTDPATSGYGIYLVLWFGANETKPPPDGERPATPQELRQRLEQELTPDEARKISVIVMDVTKPGEPRR